MYLVYQVDRSKVPFNDSRTTELLMHCDSTSELAAQNMNVYLERENQTDPKMTCRFDSGKSCSTTSGNYQRGLEVYYYVHFEIRPAPKVN